MNTPPLLLGATLLFWGWQTGFYLVGAIMAAVLESARFLKARWDLSDEDFSRIWTFCSVLLLAVTVYAFTSNEGPSSFGRWLREPNLSTQNSAGRASAETATALFRWLPMIYFLFVTAQAYSSRQEIPLTIISRILRRRWRKAEQLGQPLPVRRGLNVAYPYFAICLCAAGCHPSENSGYFWGVGGLLTWALWALRPRRYRPAVWLGLLAFAMALGYGGQRSIGRLQNYLTNLNPEWLSRLISGRRADPLLSRTSLGQIGWRKLSGQIVVRLEPTVGDAPAYLREASYRVFKWRSWTVDRQQSHFDGLNPEMDTPTWLLLPRKTNTAQARITCYLDRRSADGDPIGVLPLPMGCGRLDNLPSYTTIRRNGLGTVTAEGPGLVIFDAGYGPGASLDSPFDPDESLARTNRGPRLPGQPRYRFAEGEDYTNPEINPNPDLYVPTNERPALIQVIAELGAGNLRPAEKVRAVNGFFADKFAYSLWQEPVGLTNVAQTPTRRFLLETRRGHCEYFATATVLLLRELGVPARYVVGYVVHEKSGDGYVIRARDAHAWCLVWNEGTRTWQDFDTTPASWMDAEARRGSGLQWFSDLWSWVKLQIARFRWGQTHLREYLFWILTPVLLLLLYQVIFRRTRKLKRGQKLSETDSADGRPGMDSEFYLIEKWLATRGFPRQPNEPLADWLERAAKEQAPADIRKSLKALLGLHYRYRFDPLSLDPAGRAELKRGANEVLDALAKS